MHHSKPGHGSKVQLPITPMLDVALQLLFFFIINFNPADREGQVELALPPATRRRSTRRALRAMVRWSFRST
jgi:biopolymer transport protein ExbD